jgi:hypothetical protein
MNWTIKGLLFFLFFCFLVGMSRHRPENYTISCQCILINSNTAGTTDSIAKFASLLHSDTFSVKKLYIPSLSKLILLIDVDTISLSTGPANDPVTNQGIRQVMITSHRGLIP